MEKPKKQKYLSLTIRFFHDDLFNFNLVDTNRKRILSIIIFYLTCLTIGLTLIGQMPIFSSIKITSLFQIGWIILLIPLFILDYRLLLRSLINSIIIISPFLVYSVVAYSLNINVFLYQGTTNIFLCLYIFMLGICFGKYFNTNFIKGASLAFIATAVFYGVVVYIQKLHGNIGAEEIYAFDDKNSAGPIFLIAGILSFYVFNKRIISHYLLKITIFLGFSFLIVIAKCRATMVCLPVVLLLIHIFLPQKGKSRILSRILFPVSMVAGIALLFTIPVLYNKIIVHFILNDKKTLAEAFSGRFELIKAAIDLLKLSKNILMGTGGYYVDCMPVSLVVSYGAIGTFCLIPIIVLPWYSIIKNRKKLHEQLYFIVQLSILLIIYINGLFEGYGFFGPGAKIFLLWLISGFSFFNFIKVPEEESKIIKVSDKPACYISKVKTKPFSLIFMLLIIASSATYFAFNGVVFSTGTKIYEYLPVSRETKPLQDANDMEIDKDYLVNNLDFGSTSKFKTIGLLCVGQRILLKDTWIGKGEFDQTFARRWYTEQFDPKTTTATSCVVDPITGLLYAKEVSNKECIVSCKFSNPKKFTDGTRPYLQIIVQKSSQYKFKNCYIDKKPFNYSFDLSKEIKEEKIGTEDNPIKIKKGSTSKVYYDNFYVPNVNGEQIFQFISSDDDVATVDKNGDIKTKKSGKFNVSGKIYNFNTKNKLYFEVTEDTTTVTDFNVNFDKPCYQHVPYKINFTFNPNASEDEKEIDISVTNESGESVGSDTYLFDEITNEVTFKKDGNYKIKVTPKSNTNLSTEKEFEVIKNLPKKISCSLNHHWLVVGESKTAEQLGLNITYDNGYTRPLEDTDLKFDIENEYDGSRLHMANSYRNGFYNGNLTSIRAVKSGSFSFTYVAKEKNSVKLNLNLTCNVLTYEQYHQLCLNLGIIFGFVISIILSAFLLGVEIKKKLIYILLSLLSVLSICPIVILLYPINLCSIICVSTFAGIVFLLTLFRLIFLNNKNVKIIEDVKQ